MWNVSPQLKNTENVSKIGVLLINLGTPRSSHPRDVKRYLNEFLTDRHVIDLPWLARQFLTRCVIVPRRYRSSAALYQMMWTKEGSPLLVHTLALKEALQSALGERFCVQLAMRYQTPSISEGLKALKLSHLSSLIIVPLFPQFSTATTGSIQSEVLKQLRYYSPPKKFHLIKSYPDHPGLIATFLARARQFQLNHYDQILFSYHGLPEKQLKKANPFAHCLQTANCCAKLKAKNKYCYSAQCFATTRALVKALGLPSDRFTHCYQSRLGRSAWLRPYTADVIVQAAKEGKKKLLVACPSFVADCLETLVEIQCEYRDLFLKAGGEKLDLIKAPNTHPTWVLALKEMILNHT